MKAIKWLKVRVIDHWETTLAGILLLVGYAFFHQGKIDFADFKEYIALVPTIVLFLTKKKLFTKDEKDS